MKGYKGDLVLFKNNFGFSKYHSRWPRRNFENSKIQNIRFWVCRILWCFRNFKQKPKTQQTQNGLFTHKKCDYRHTTQNFKKPNSMLNSMSEELSIDTTFGQNGQSQKYSKILTKLFATVNTYECAHVHGHYGQVNRSQ